MSNALPAPDPSMDEILASIKRIIESGDEKVARRSPTDAGSRAVVSSFPASYAAALRPMADEHRDETLDDQGAGHSHARSELRDRDEDFAQRLPDTSEAFLTPDEESAISRAAFGSNRFDDDAFESELVQLIGDGDEGADEGFADADQADDWDGLARFEAANSDEAGRRRSPQEDQDEPPFGPAGALADPAETHRIISQEAGARVAASFEDLARAMREDQMRSVEDAVQDMLRPMLQEWLDDNLPRLVERLVREEIERVATGGRR
ncbi:DUF2497 domain-containing protein [Aurantimonas aggregata]|uniref:DUF2497 domain-containing protein n=1 Tax=Aurantimonas aggregata TaxID=2047720 RepID=A0A6L9MBF6_9HYPH|nr:DUF2497 domain-containing protein [Aurantimonas aggregata]NDV85133.1 DUF2497 domain-containing protein [Aurantimonas aggregata]